MKTVRSMVRSICLALLGLSAVFACGFDATLREYLNIQFWLPFSKQVWEFEKKNIRRSPAAYAGMEKASEHTPLSRLRAAYQEISDPEHLSFDSAKLQRALSEARATGALTPRQQEEVKLIDAKIDLRAGSQGDDKVLESARAKLNEFLRTAETPEFRSEARGWQAHIHFVRGEQAAAGKIYLDELNRNGSILSRETLLNSLRLTYGYDGGPELIEHLDEYFDTAEHAAFAIQLVTNPHWTREWPGFEVNPPPVVSVPAPYERIKSLLTRHASLLRLENGSNALALLGMRTALRAGDPPAALKLAGEIPGNAAVRSNPDFNWMLASAYFLSRDYRQAEHPLLRLFRSGASTENQKSAAAYALCGVYLKNRNPVEQLRFALWLHTQVRAHEMYESSPQGVEDQSIYWAVSGWDLNLLLESETSIATLRTFLVSYPNMPDARLVRYSLAVRLARENKYEEAADIYDAVNAHQRASRMRELARLYSEANRFGAPAEERRDAAYRLAEFIGSNPEKLYFNDALWRGYQRHALVASEDSRLTGAERRELMKGERKLQDDQEERWRAYLLLREIVTHTGSTDLGRRSARLAIRCLDGISERFGRGDEIHAADAELISWIHRSSR